MKTVYITWLLAIAAGLTAAGTISADDRPTSPEYESIQSPSRRYMAIYGIGLAEVSPSIRMRLRILVVDLGGVKVDQHLPWVTSPYTVIWSKNDVLLVCGASDDSEGPKTPFRISALQVHADGKVEVRKATPTEQEKLLSAFSKKHGYQPSPIIGEKE